MPPVRLKANIVTPPGLSHYTLRPGLFIKTALIPVFHVMLRREQDLINNKLLGLSVCEEPVLVINCGC